MLLSLARSLRLSFCLAVISPNALAATTVVGTTAAEFDVANGNVNYSVPIQVPAGRGGMQPELSLNYSGSCLLYTSPSPRDRG